jgi:hypothetical protein
LHPLLLIGRLPERPPGEQPASFSQFTRRCARRFPLGAAGAGGTPLNHRYDLPHLIVSLVALIGGGYLAARYPEMRGELGMLLAGICGFWFGTKSSNGAPK